MSAFETIMPKKKGSGSKENAMNSLRWATFFLGEVRDGLTMINMQAAFLIVSKNYDEKQAGLLFLVFGMSQFLFQSPAGYLCDYTERKVLWLSAAAATTTLLTLFTAVFAEPEGRNLWLMVLVKFLQGAATAFITPGLNSITQGIVGSTGMTKQVSINEMMSHLGTSLSVFVACTIAFLLFPDVWYCFFISPVACVGALWFLNMIRPQDIDHAAARGLTLEVPNIKPSSSSYSRGSYTPPGGSASGSSPTKRALNAAPSFNFGFGSTDPRDGDSTQKAETPLQVLRDPILLTFILIVFLFHTANGTILPLVMQTLAIGEGRNGIPYSGFCIIVAQAFMVLSAKVCGDYSAIYGRKTLFLIGFFVVPVRCFLLSFLLKFGETWPFVSFLILSTQILDGIGAGVFGTMYVLVTSDISGGTGRFSFMLGLTTAAVSVGGTISGYLGEALAYHLGYMETFFILMFMSLVPALVYLFCMPETLPALVKAQQGKIAGIVSIDENEEYHESELPPMHVAPIV